ncbi:hypothetical protein DL95DRAFT_393473 [Leptodontidium sp. 2 PMI_412]|nr:hypothetical protein DL95DRAFT_393473 [Leptodontidium sp. 2 PMI_412]
MKFTSAILLGISASLTRADWGPNGFGGNNWGNWGGGSGFECAKSCFSSAFPDQSTAWSSACASQTAIDSCVSSACPTASAQYSSASSIRSEWCSSYSSCSTASDSCTTAWPWWNGSGDDGWGGIWGGRGPGGIFTVTVTTGQASGLTTRTVTVTTTASGSQVQSTQTQTGTIVLAQAANSPTSTPTSTNAAAPGATNGAGALVVAALGAFMAL